VVQNRTLALPVQKRKDQCGQIALAFHLVVSSRLAFDGIECELEIEATEFRLDLYWIRLQQTGEVLELFVNPRLNLREFFSRHLLGLPLQLPLEPFDGRFALADGFQQHRRRIRPAFNRRDEILQLLAFLLQQPLRRTPFGLLLRQ